MAKAPEYDPFWINPYYLCKKAGIEVREVEELEDGLESRSFIENGKGVIEVLSSLPSTSKRFYVAHGLGHFKNGDFDYHKEFEEESMDLDDWDLFENGANEYALELLMPVSKIDFLIRQGLTTTSKIAVNLGVPEEVAIKRLQDLEYIS